MDPTGSGDTVRLNPAGFVKISSRGKKERPLMLHPTAGNTCDRPRKLIEVVIADQLYPLVPRLLSVVGTGVVRLRGS